MSLSYVKQIWRPRADPLGETKFTSARMNHMEDGIQGSSAPIVTQLPSAANAWAPFGAEPGAGQEVILRVNDGAGHPLAMWRMVYVPGETYPWYFVGGSDAYTYTAGAVNVGWNGAWALNQGDGGLTLPSAGDYDFSFDALIDDRGAASARQFFIGVAMGAFSPSTSDCIEWWNAVSTEQEVHVSRMVRYTARAAAEVAKLGYLYNTNVGNVVWVYRRTLRMRPFRLS